MFFHDIKKNVLLIIVLCITIISSVTTNYAQIPRNISYQGILADNNGALVPDGNYSLTFKLYDDPVSGTYLWQEIQSTAVNKGIFNVILGEINPLTIPFDNQYWLGVKIGSGSELAPRIPLTSSAYSINAISVVDNSITSLKIADGSVKGQDIELATIPPEKLVPGAADGEVLTTDGGLVKWQVPPGGGGLALPYSNTVASNSNAFWISNSGDGKAVVGTHTANGNYGELGAQDYGIHAVAFSGKGIFAQSSQDDGVAGTSDGSTKSGVYGYHSKYDGFAIYGRNWGSGCFGYIGGAVDGVYGETNDDYGQGLHGYGTGTTTEGVLGVSVNNTGVYGISGGTSGNNFGVWGQSDEGIGVVGMTNSGTAIKALGSFVATGTKSAEVKLDNGTPIRLFAEEAAEVFFSDYGEGKLVNGRAHIDLDPVFLQTVTINAQYPLKAFIQLEGDCKGAFVANKTNTGFDVIELQDGISNVPFSYRIICKRKHFENERLATIKEDNLYNKQMLDALWPEIITQQQAQMNKLKAK